MDIRLDEPLSVTDSNSHHRIHCDAVSGQVAERRRYIILKCSHFLANQCSQQHMTPIWETVQNPDSRVPENPIPEFQTVDLQV